MAKTYTFDEGYSGQIRSLRLRPWQDPPCCIDDPEVVLDEPDDHKGRHAAARLALKMQALGVDRNHPDPLVAIAEAEAALQRQRMQ